MSERITTDQARILADGDYEPIVQIGIGTTINMAHLAAEAVEPVFGESAADFADAVSDIQSVLGDHQDAAIAADLVLHLSTSAKGTRAPFALGALYSQQRLRVAEARREFVEIWPRVSHSAWRTWMTTEKSQP